MNHPLNFITVLMLVIPPLLWAGNAIVGRMVSELIPPILFNFMRWVIALAILIPLGRSLFRQAGWWRHWRRFALLGLLGVGLYNTLQYLALQTSSPINVTLVGASMPMFMLAIGRLFFGVRVSVKQMLGTLLSIVGVLVVLSRGEWQHLLTLHLVPGDIFMILAAIVWSIYSWLLAYPKEPEAIRKDWAAFLLAQVLFGVAWSGVFATGEWVTQLPQISWGWTLAAALLYVATGPAIIAFGLWGAGVRRVGPNIAVFFSNLIPLFAAVLSLAFLGEIPELYHGLAFMLIVGGIILSSRR